MSTSHENAPASEAPQKVSPTLRNLWWSTIQVVLRLVFTIWLRYRCYGLENLPKTTGGLLLVNHQSFLDPLLVGLPLTRPVCNLARDSLFRVPVIGTILRNTYVEAINRDNASTASLRIILNRLEAGYLCGVFPEGTRSPTGEVGEMKPGFVTLVRRTKVPVFPIGIAGAHLALGKGSFWFRPQRVCVVYGKQLDPAKLEELKQRGREEELVQYVREAITECQQRAERMRMR